MSRLSQVLAAIDDANGQDPEPADWRGNPAPRAWIYGKHMSEMLSGFAPDASEPLQIAVRAQHIERWTVPRDSYPQGRTAYLQWRKDLQRHHARRAGELMQQADYPSDDIERVGRLLRKERLKYDADVQILEDVACLVFLRFEAADFIAGYADDKVRDILAKTARKMSPRGLEAAAALTLDTRLARLLNEALGARPEQTESQQ
jgi:hypothetical protein